MVIFVSSQILQYVGKNLVSLDISGGMTEGLSDDGLAAIPEYCDSLEELVVRMLSKVKCVTLMPLFRNKDKALKMRKLYLSSPVCIYVMMNFIDNSLLMIFC